MPDGPRKATLRAPTLMERIKGGLQDTLGIPERVWGMPLPDQTIEAHRELNDAKAAKGPVWRAPTVMERIQETLRPIANVVEAVGTPFDNADVTGPAKAITLATKKPILELMKRLAPRDAKGMMVDPAEFPNIYEAVNTAIETHPRVMSHLHNVALDIPETSNTYGLLGVPNHITKYMRNVGPDVWKGMDAGPVANMRLNRRIEGMPGEAANTVFHETGHLAQFLMDPTKMMDVSAQAERMLNRIPSVGARPGLNYQLNPSEISARAMGARGVQRVAGEELTPFLEALRQQIPGGTTDPAVFGDIWQQARQAFVEEAGQRGIRLRPMTMAPTPKPSGPVTQGTLFRR